MVLATSAWRAERNAKARARLMRRLPDVFPPVVLAHALAKPFVPPTPRRAIESYWRHHPVRADKLPPPLAATSRPPAGLARAADKPRQGGPSGELPRAARALSRGRAREGPGPLLRVRPAGVPARLA